MKLLAFAASNSSQSINRQLLTYAERLIKDGLVANVDVEWLDLNDYEMPIYSSDRENESGIPQAAHDFYAKIGEADAVLVSFAEHNGFFTAAYKNIFDWVSRIDMRVYQERPTVFFATSPGKGGAANVLATAVNSGQYFGYEVKASLSIPNFYENFDTDAGILANAELDQQFRTAIAELNAIERATS